MAILSILTVTLVLLPRGAPPLFRRAPPLSRGVAPCLMVAEPPTRIPSPLRVYAPQAPVPMVEIRAGGQKSVYQGTLASIRSSYKLSSRDARLLRSPTRQLSPRQGYILFDFGDLRGVLQHDRLILLGADGAAVQALGEEIQQRLALSDVPTEEEAPFEVRVLEAMLEQSYSLLEESLVAAKVSRDVGIVCFHPRYETPSENWLATHRFGHMYAPKTLRRYCAEAGADDLAALPDDDLLYYGSYMRRSPHATINVLWSRQLAAAEQRRESAGFYARNLRRLVDNGRARLEAEAARERVT